MPVITTVGIAVGIANQPHEFLPAKWVFTIHLHFIASLRWRREVDHPRRLSLGKEEKNEKVVVVIVVLGIDISLCTPHNSIVQLDCPILCQSVQKRIRCGKLDHLILMFA